MFYRLSEQIPANVDERHMLVVFLDMLQDGDARKELDEDTLKWIASKIEDAAEIATIPV